MAGRRLGFLAAAIPGWLVTAWVVACGLLGMACSANASVFNERTFAAIGELKDKIFTGDGVLSFADVSDLTCARRCLQELGCGFFFYNSADTACALAPSGTNKTLTDAPGYQLFATTEGPSGAPSDDRRLCPSGTDTPRGCWKRPANGWLYQVSVGPAGVWGIGGYGDGIYHYSGTYQHPDVMGTHWVQVNGRLGQVESGPDYLWGVTAGGTVYASAGSSPLAGVWRLVGDAFRWVSVSPQGSVWVVKTTGHLLHGPNAASGALPVDQWDVVEGDADLQRVDAGRAGVWALDNAGRLHYRLGTCGQDGGSGTGWRQVGGAFTSVSSGRDLVVAVDTAGHVWLRTCMGADTPASMGWAWLSGGLAQVEIYQSGDVTAMWAVDGVQGIYFMLL